MGLLSKIISLGIILSRISPHLKLLCFNKEPHIDAEEPSEQALLREYEVCQQSINSISANYWLIAGIFMAINSVLLALIGQLLYSSVMAHALGSTIELPVTAKVLISAPGIAMIFVLVFLITYLNRVNYVNSLTYCIMRKTETKLDMSKNLTVHDFDKWKKLPETRKKELAYMRDKYPSKPWYTFLWRSECYEPPGGARGIKWIYYIFILLWIVAILMVWFSLIIALIPLFVFFMILAAWSIIKLLPKLKKGQKA